MNISKWMVIVLDWSGWTLDRIIVLAMGLLFQVIFVQVTLFHYRQNFRHWSMWIPVLGTPLTLPSLVSAVSILGLIVLHWGWVYTSEYEIHYPNFNVMDEEEHWDPHT
ncbi:hypothetical protein V7147_18715 [Bacillus sp. JJ1521]|uniref:hypothetical protein n=1 Tax=Bacillus sp. JJ1521 TaxID=3122957 RepID=UPI002FFDFF23